jgi:hypothetical protein
MSDRKYLTVRELYEIIKEYPDFYLFATLKGRELIKYPIVEIDFDEYTREKVILYASQDKFLGSSRNNKNISNFINYIENTFEVSLDYRTVLKIEELQQLGELQYFKDFKIDNDNKRIILIYDLVN